MTGPENWNTEGPGAHAASIPYRAFQFQGMRVDLAVTAISLPTRERFLGTRPSALPHWVQHGAIRLSRLRNQDFSMGVLCPAAVAPPGRPHHRLL